MRRGSRRPDGARRIGCPFGVFLLAGWASRRPRSRRWADLGTTLGTTLSTGPLVGAIDDVGVKIWARAAGMPPLTYSLAVRYGEIGDPAGTITPSVTLADGADFTGTVEITGLAPGTAHWFEMMLDGTVVAGSDGAFVTLPPRGEPSAFRFALGSCTDHIEMPFPIFDVISGDNPSFLLHVGDSIYADHAPVATQQAEFEARYRLNFDESRWRALMRQLPSFMIWDDHEIENNWSDGQTGLYLEARPAFDEYVAAHNPAPRIPGELYYDFSVGEADFFVLDTRSFRDLSSSIMLGATQRAELESWLSSSTATFKFVVSSVQWSFLSQNVDTWFGFPSERDAFFDFVKDNAIPGVVLLSGDRHWTAVFRHEAVAPYYLYEFSSSPLGGVLREAPDPDSDTLFLWDSSRSFLTIDVDTTVSPATLYLRVVDDAGTERFALSLTEDDIFVDLIFADGFESGDASAWSSVLP